MTGTKRAGGPRAPRGDAVRAPQARDDSREVVGQDGAPPFCPAFRPSAGETIALGQASLERAHGLVNQALPSPTLGRSGRHSWRPRLPQTVMPPAGEPAVLFSPGPVGLQRPRPTGRGGLRSEGTGCCSCLNTQGECWSSWTAVALCLGIIAALFCTTAPSFPMGRGLGCGGIWHTTILQAFLHVSASRRAHRGDNVSLLGSKHRLRLFCQRCPRTWLGYRLGALMRNNRLRCGVCRHRNMIADSEALPGCHGAPLRLGHSERKCCPRLPCLKPRLGLSLARAAWVEVCVPRSSGRMRGLRRERLMCSQRFARGSQLLRDWWKHARERLLTHMTVVPVARLALAALASAQLLSTDITSLA